MVRQTVQTVDTSNNVCELGLYISKNQLQVMTNVPLFSYCSESIQFYCANTHFDGDSQRISVACDALIVLSIFFSIENCVLYAFGGLSVGMITAENTRSIYVEKSWNNLFETQSISLFLLILYQHHLLSGSCVRLPACTLLRISVNYKGCERLLWSKQKKIFAL